MVTLINPEVITESLESFKKMRNGHKTDLGGIYTVKPTFQHFTSETGTSMGVDL